MSIWQARARGSVTACPASWKLGVATAVAAAAAACSDYSLTVLQSRDEVSADGNAGGHGGDGGGGLAAGSSAMGDDGLCTQQPCDQWGAQPNGTFKNPILWSDLSNVDVIRVASDFYMVAATHHLMGIPVLESQDLVNWHLVARVYDSLHIDARYATPGQAYQHGSWSATLRQHEGEFLLYTATPAEGVYFATAPSPAGPWSDLQLLHAVEGWQDPAPFWDDVPNAGGDGPDGRQAYLLRSQFGASLIQLHRMSWDGRSLQDPVGVELATGSGYSGPKLHKRNGYYCIFAPQGSISRGEQVVFRSAQVDGGYEKRVLLEQGTTDLIGPHGGAWVDLPTGEAWFYHNQQVQGWGRVVHLQPARWNDDDWPSIGIDWDGNGIGEPELDVDMPDVGSIHPPELPASSDDFGSNTLGLQWMWNHNPNQDGWSLTARPGWLRLEALPVAAAPGESALGEAISFEEDSLLFAYNVLVQRAMGRNSTGRALLDTSFMADGQRAGLALFGQSSAWVGVIMADGSPTVTAQIDGSQVEGPLLEQGEIHLEARLTEASDAVVAYSLDGVTYIELGSPLHVNRTFYEGIKYALFTYQLSTSARGGSADFDYFHLAHDGPARPAP